MQETHCPICYGELEVREVAPCYDCGADPRELDHLREGQHKYAEYQLFGTTIVLCDFCDADFGSYDPAYIGRPAVPDYCFQMVSLKEVEPTISHDKFCPACKRGLAFLRFLLHARGGSE